MKFYIDEKKKTVATLKKQFKAARTAARRSLTRENPLIAEHVENEKNKLQEKGKYSPKKQKS